MKHKIVIIVMVLLASTAFLSAQDLTVDYLEGYLDLQKGNSWVEIYMGDTIPRNAKIRLDEDSLAELSGMNMSFILTRPGIYTVEEMLSSRQTMNNSGLGNLVTGKVSALFSERATGPDTVGGIRASEAVAGPTVDWMTSEAADMISRAREMITQEDYQKAMDLLNEAMDYAVDEYEEGEISFYRGYIHTVNGKAGRALAEFGAIDPDPDQTFYDNLYLLKGKILIDSFAFDEALQWFDTYNPVLQTGEGLSVQQSIYLLHGLAAREAGMGTKASALFQKVVKLNPSSDTAAVAQSLLQE
ncbi:MAG: hypothetical protein JW760_02435 [Spirochaetales bacterium]|nr:hypothetical protein [Spirochaetales bacterium]